MTTKKEYGIFASLIITVAVSSTTFALLFDGNIILNGLLGGIIGFFFYLIILNQALLHGWIEGS